MQSRYKPHNVNQNETKMRLYYIFYLRLFGAVYLIWKMPDNFKTQNNKSLLKNSVVDPDPYVFGLPDLHPDPLVTSTDPAPDPSIIKQK